MPAYLRTGLYIAVGIILLALALVGGWFLSNSELIPFSDTSMGRVGNKGIAGSLLKPTGELFVVSSEMAGVSVKVHNRKMLQDWVERWQSTVEQFTEANEKGEADIPILSIR